MWFKRKKYLIIKFFKIVDLKSAKEFNTVEVFKLCCSFYEDILGSKPNSYSKNYQDKVWKSNEKFLKSITEYPGHETVYLYAGYEDKENNNTYLVSTNTILNFENPPEKSSIDIEIAVEASKVNINQVKSFIQKLYEYFDYDYGYCVELNENFDFQTEKKESGIFSNNLKVNSLEQQWIFHSAGIKEGFIKKLYKFNILNSSQLDQPIIKRLVERGIGDIRKLNDSLSIWELSDKDYEIAHEELSQSKYMIINEKNTDLFLDSTEAKRFNELMKLR